jgi:hypothetical protein
MKISNQEKHCIILKNNTNQNNYTNKSFVSNFNMLMSSIFKIGRAHV